MWSWILKDYVYLSYNGSILSVNFKRDGCNFFVKRENIKIENQHVYVY